MAQGVVDAVEQGALAFDGGEVDGVGEVVAVGQWQRLPAGAAVAFGAGALRGLEVAYQAAGLVDPHPEPQVEQVLERVAATAALGGGDQSEDTAFGGGVFGVAADEAAA